MAGKTTRSTAAKSATKGKTNGEGRRSGGEKISGGRSRSAAAKSNAGKGKNDRGPAPREAGEQISISDLAGGPGVPGPGTVLFRWLGGTPVGRFVLAVLSMVILTLLLILLSGNEASSFFVYFGAATIVALLVIWVVYLFRSRHRHSDHDPDGPPF